LNELFCRPERPYFAVFPALVNCFWTSADQELKQNCEAVRTFCRDLVRLKKAEFKGTSQKPTDVIQVMLEDEAYADEELIVDELASFLAATIPSHKVVIVNMLLYMTIHQNHEKALRDEIN
jgi:cytochrome P450